MAPQQKAETTENNGMQRYYLITFVMFAALSVYCFSFVSAWQSYTCLVNDDLALQAAQA